LLFALSLLRERQRLNVVKERHTIGGDRGHGGVSTFLEISSRLFLG